MEPDRRGFGGTEPAPSPSNRTSSVIAMPQATTLESTVLRRVQYDAATQHLDVQFRDHAVYGYVGVPAEVHAALLHSSSKGSGFNREIRGRFPFVLVRARARPYWH